MKRLHLWLNELSLTQQLLGIILLFVALLGGFVFFFLSPAIDRFSTTEAYEQLHNSQSSIIYYVNEHPSELPELGSTDATIVQAMYDPDSDTLTIMAGNTLPAAVTSDIRTKAEEDLAGTQDYSVDAVQQSDTSKTSHYLYSMTLLKDGRFLVSVIQDAYRVQFRKSLFNGIILMNVVVVSVLFILLIVWVSSLIYPLSQIKTYITRIKNDEPAVLNVKRNDEIGEVAYALTEMEDELSKQNREKQEMIQNISHDLKTPIATIKSYSEAIKDGVYPYETLEKSVDVIIEHADRLEKKVKSLIVLNKMDYLLDECPEGDNLDMNDVIQKAILSLKVIKPEIDIIADTDPDIKFHGEEEPWRITVENLIDNALRYAKKTITVTLHENELCVKDDGRSIDESVLQSLFHPYEKGTDGQFGLGLSIVYKVCTTYGYRVEAENLPEGGVSFRIWKDKSRHPHHKKHNSAKEKETAVKKA
jgi:two-component system sensor histidine kinase CssS